ncbi:flavin reductase family protein [Nonomuraea glycinis]|uniref:flavin reductase family protein n=1 Tax=Nonomuraea glycinis TaxID=2047744 RepID=UPI002E0D6003|nr:flavin reductase family protein [Nonomuraea glycinis]
MSALPAIASEDLRSAMGCFATGVVVITATLPDGPVGMAVNSFVSVSLNPPLVLFCAGNTSTTWPAINAAGHFCANVLSADQEALARAFARKGDRFAGVTHTPGVTGAPVLEAVHAHLECKIVDTYDAGDHTVVIGRVVDLDTDQRAAPLLFYRSAYRLF